MTVPTLRFATKRDLEKVIKGCQMTNVVRAQDERGHYIASYTAPDWFNAMPFRSERLAAPAPRRAAARAPAPRRGSGTCAAIREWVLANPQASRQDALAQFASANPTTVGVQYTQARRTVNA